MRIFILCAAIGVASAAIAEKPAPVRLYCFSESSEAGFSDKWTDFYCEALQKRGKKKKSLVFVERAEADILIRYIGSQERAVEGETTLYSGGIAVRPSDIMKVTDMDMMIGDFTKRFSNEYPAVIDEIEEWIRENREVILEKARQK